MNRGIKTKVQNMSLFLVSIIFCCIFGEILTRFFWAAPGFKYPQTLHRYHEILRWEMIPNQKAYTYDIPVYINSHGLRDDEFPLKKSSNTIRLLNLGDSVTFGVFVKGEETYPNRLEDILNQAHPDKSFEVINAGVQRYFTYQELDYLKLKGLEFQPDIVIIGFYINDLGIRPEVWKRGYESDREKLMNRLWENIPFVMSIVKNSALISLIRDRYLRLKNSFTKNLSAEEKLLEGLDDREMNQLWQATREYLSVFKMLGQDHNFHLLLVAFPGINQVVFNKNDANYPSKLREIAEELDIPFVDLLPAFKDYYTGDIRSLYFRSSGHPNSRAHQLAAQVIYRHLLEFNLLPISKKE